MKKINKSITNHSFFVLFLLSFFQLPFGQPNVQITGIASNIKEIKEILAGFQSFIAKIISFTSLIGINTLVLLLGVIIISTALSIIGIRKGKVSFFSSLIIADVLWALWETSFSPLSFAFVLTILKTNLVLITPFLFAFLVRIAYPQVSSKIVEAITAKFRKNKGFYSKKRVSYLADEVQEKFTNFQKELLHDIIHSTDSEKIYISNKSLRFKKELENTLLKIK